MAAPKKPALFEHLFYWRYNADGSKVPRWDSKRETIPEAHRLVYGDEVQSAIRETAAGLKHNQNSSFTKDFLRTNTRNKNWPKRLKDLRWTAKQRAGNDDANRLRNFVFLPYKEDQTEPFPDECPIPDELITDDVQSVTMSIASKQIGRLDEPRLMQIVADLRIVETHFALHSPIREELDVLHLDLLQMGLKLRGAEIDGLYLAQCRHGNQDISVLITIEAKTHNQFIVLSQIIAQVEHASTLGLKWNKIIPLALKSADGGLYIFEFAPFNAPESGKFAKDSLEQDLLGRPKATLYRVLPQIRSLRLRKRGTNPGPTR